MLSKKWLAGALFGAFLAVAAGAGVQQAEASALTPNAIQAASGETVELARYHHGGPHGWDRHRDPYYQGYHERDRREWCRVHHRWERVGGPHHGGWHRR